MKTPPLIAPQLEVIAPFRVADRKFTKNSVTYNKVADFFCFFNKKVPLSSQTAAPKIFQTTKKVIKKPIIYLLTHFSALRRHSWRRSKKSAAILPDSDTGNNQFNQTRI